MAHEHHVPIPECAEDLEVEDGATDIRYPELGAEGGQIQFEPEHSGFGRGQTRLVLALHRAHGAEGLAGFLDELVAHAQSVSRYAPEAVRGDDQRESAGRTQLVDIIIAEL